MIAGKHRAWFAVLVALAFCPAVAGAREKLCLVLGGGGARGAAHIGVLRVLERERIPVDCITGTSMGAIVGALYALGYSADEIEQIVHAIDWKAVFRDEPERPNLPVRLKQDDLRYLLGLELGVGRDGKLRLPTGAIQGQQIELLLRRLLLPAWNVEHFADLPIPFRTIATDITSGEAVVFEQGDLATAVRASMSVPGAFAPVRYGERLLVDGGVVDNVPIDLAKALGAERIIAINVGAGLLAADKLVSPLAITMQTLSALMVRQTEQQLTALDPRDVLIRPDLGDIGSASFDRALEAVPLGAAATEAALPQLRAFALSPDDYAAWRAAHRRREFDPPLIAFLRVLNDESVTAGFVDHTLRDQVGKPFDAQAVEKALERSYGTGDYQRIGYRLVEEAGQTGLVVEPQDKSWGPGFVKAGLSISDDFAGRSAYQLNVEARLTGLNDAGAYWRTQIDAGQFTGVRSEFVQPFGRVGQYFVEPYLDYHAYEQTVGLGRPPLADLRITEATAGFNLGWNPSPWWQLSTFFETGHDRARLHIGDPVITPGGRDGWGGYGFEVIRDTLDSGQFPRSGSRTQMAYTIISPTLGAENGGAATAFVWDKALTYGRHTVLLGLRGQTTWDDPEALRTTSFLGGLTNLSGYADREIFDEHSLLARAVYYRRFGRLDALFSVPAYLGASLEYGGVFASRREIRPDNMTVAGSVFLGVETPFGPMFFGYGRNDEGYDSLYLNFGSLLRPLER